MTPELLILNHHLSNRVFDFSSERFGVLLFPLSRCCGASTAVAAKKFEPPQGQRPSGHRRRSNRKRQQKWRVFLCAARAVVLSRACNEVGHGRGPCAFSRRFCAVKSGAAGGGSFHDLRHPYVKHTTKNKSLQKQKSQTINADSLGFLFFEDVAFVLVRFNFPLLEKKVEIASAHLFESF